MFEKAKNCLSVLSFSEKQAGVGCRSVPHSLKFRNKLLFFLSLEIECDENKLVFKLSMKVDSTKEGRTC